MKNEELLSIVARLTEKYTSKESTSVTYDRARKLMNAVIYTIRENDSRRLTGKALMEQIAKKEQSAQILYDNGKEILAQKISAANSLYQRILKEFDSYGNECYEETVVKGFPAFFLYYDPDFEPQNHLLTLDYPTMRPLGKKTGIDAIYDYLGQVYLEQQFLHAFSKESVYDLLSRVYDDYEELIIHVGKCVLRNVIGNMMLQKNISSLTLLEEDYCRIAEMVKETGREELEQKIRGLIETLVKHVYQDQKELRKYLTEDVSDFAAELRNAAENNCMSAIF